MSKPTFTLVSRLSPDQTGITGEPPPMPLTAENLYNTYRASLLKYLIGMLPGGRQDALEILHETYIRLLQHEDLERIQQNPRAYIFTIATNLVTDWLRRRHSRRQDFHDSFDELEFPCDEMTPIRALNWEQSLAQLKQALMGLPTLTRQIFLLSRFDELTYPEIARELNISTRTVERHMSSAFHALQQSLEDFL
ncbi:RNA polymerase sigma factor [Cellvibrio mixtus]|uniref:RNA polymerase sigma factor n=1 Tax=Cellvibrio mixtus TaxID=39650 RepID=UPI0006942022|nr:RNA polymerase sigma factor [Cellvibrio mixtus]